MRVAFRGHDKNEASLGKPHMEMGGKTKSGGPCWIRTNDLLVKSQLLYRLS